MSDLDVDCSKRLVQSLGDIFYLDDGPPEKASMTFSGVTTLSGRQLRRAVRNFESSATKKQGLLRTRKTEVQKLRNIEWLLGFPIKQSLLRRQSTA